MRRLRVAAWLVAVCMALTGFAAVANGGVKQDYTHAHYTVKNHYRGVCKAGVNIRRFGAHGHPASPTDYRRATHRLKKCIAAHQAPTASATASGGWVIPTYIVMCESGGRNLPPNSATASGYYQIIDGTWAAYGGRAWAKEAYLAPKSAQDTVALRIWSHDGPHAWNCA